MHHGSSYSKGTWPCLYIDDRSFLHHSIPNGPPTRANYTPSHLGISCLSESYVFIRLAIPISTDSVSIQDMPLHLKELRRGFNVIMRPHMFAPNRLIVRTSSSVSHLFRPPPVDARIALVLPCPSTTFQKPSGLLALPSSSPPPPLCLSSCSSGRGIETCFVLSIQP